MRRDSHAPFLAESDTRLATLDDPELTRLIRAERVRMLFAPTLPVAVLSAVSAIGLALLLADEVGHQRAMLWAAFCVIASLVRVMHLSRYSGASDRANVFWLHSLTALCALHGLSWGVAGFMMPVQDLVTTAVIVATLVGACAVCTFTLQAHLQPNLAINLPMLLPAALMLLTRQDAYGWYGGVGLLALLMLMLFESRRAERRITELLWLRFTTDRIARERAEALKLAQRHSAVKDQFLATMSHEMRTPLHGILGLARLVHKHLPARTGPLGEARHQVELIERTGEHLLGIINDVLDFSRIEAGRLQVDQSAFDLQTVMLDVLTLLTITASDKGLHLVTEVDLPDPCWVRGDPARVRQVLHNLVGNAIKFTEAGQVTVRVQRAPGATGLPDAEATMPPVLFEVEDTGVGIPPHHLPLIFEAFHQVDGSFGRRHHGTGLGLTISREIARAMGGDITCRSTPGKGSVFSLTVPLPAVPVQQVDVNLPIGMGTREGHGDASLVRHGLADPAMGLDRCQGHVLLAEDNPVNALVAEAALANLGLQVTRVEDGEQALAALQTPGHGFDLVLMDCQMPVLDGIEATRRLRAWEHDRGRDPIAVIALTANALSSDRERCMAAGMNEHLAKPFRQEELLAVLQRHLLSALPTTSPGVL